MVSLFAVPSGASPLPSALRRVIALIIVNLGLSAALTVLVLIFNHSLINYQVAHTALQPGVNEVVLRASLQLASWSRLVGVGVVALVYFFLVKRLREGRRRAYLRTIVLAVVGLAGLALIASTTPYPWWVHVEQALQAGVLAALLWSVTRPEVRAHFANPPRQTSPAA